MSSNYVPGYGCPDAKLVCIGESPGKHECERGYPFAGPTGDLLNQAFNYAGIDRSETYLTNVSKVRPPNNKIADLHLVGTSIEEQLPVLWEELKVINPNCILLLGNTALEALTGLKGIEKYRGSILQTKDGRKAVATLHPATLLHNEDSSAKTKWAEFAWIKADVKRAAEQSYFREMRLPQRNLLIANSSIDVYRFLEKYENKPDVTLDVETFKTIVQCVGLAFNDWEAMSIPIFDRDRIPDSEMVFVWRALAEFLHDTNKHIRAQNAKFDEKRCRQVGLNWHDCDFDIAMGWHVLFPEFPKKLEFISSVITDEPYYKSEGQDFNKGRGRQANLEQWYKYNAKDAVVEHECADKIIQQLKDDNLWEFFTSKIHPLHRLYSDIEDIGILIDLEVRKHLGRKYTDLRVKKHDELVNQIASENGVVSEIIREEFQNFNVMSNGMKNQVAKLLFGYLKLPLRKDTGDDTLKALANNVCSKDKNPRRKNICLGILEERKIRKTIGTYIEAEPSPCDCSRFGSQILLLERKPRIHTQCNVNGTETGRTSTGILKPPISVDKEGIALQTMTKHEDVNLDAGGGDLRSMFIADEGWSFVEIDQSQAEDRVVCVLAKDWDALTDYNRTTFKYNKHGLKDDRHSKTACYVCNMLFEDLTDWYRQQGKKTRHAGNYDEGKHMHMLMLGKAGIFISEWTAGKQLERFHAENPKIRGIYHESIVQALQDNNCTLYTPHDRRRIFFNKFGIDMFKEAYAYIPQATVSDQTKFAMLRICNKLGKEYLKLFFFLQESHDSFLALVKDSFIRDFCATAKEAFEQPINFSKCTLARDFDLIIPCEIKIGKRWVEKSENWPDGMAKLR
jgi:uracil-DNA glycosylase